jgi:CMP-N-acetylneuraminic acid synthetase/spore coat polysaccharide biosynthesis predicted glycosyltransferase SpsG
VAGTPNRRLLAIVPARGGSRGVPRKNMRLLGGKPLIHYVLAALRESAVADRIVVSSEDAAILSWCELHDYETHLRPAELASPETTISEVAAFVADELDWDGDVGVFQPTSPLTRSSTIADAVGRFRNGDWTSLASCVRDHHLAWYQTSPDESPQPLFEARVNRQFNRSYLLRETGAIQLVRGDALRLGRQTVTAHHHLYEVDPAESLDIDTTEDLAVARRRIEEAGVVVRLTANRTVGSGHLFNGLQLAEELAEHRVSFLLRDCDPFAREVVEARGHQWREEQDLAADLAALRHSGRNLVVNDVLDTSEADVLAQRALGFVVVNFEDLGDGARLAHWVVNALYRGDDKIPDAACGPRWATLREEFHDPPPKRIHENARQVLITFGGTDPNHLAHRCAHLLAARGGLDLKVVLGPGADDADFPPGVRVERAVRSMATEMLEADLVLTSAGRTIYEAAIIGTPVVALAQNAREATHAHLGYEHGVLFLGIGPLVEDARIVETVDRLLADAALRRELSARLRSSIDSRGSLRVANRIRGLILEEA